MNDDAKPLSVALPPAEPAHHGLRLAADAVRAPLRYWRRHLATPRPQPSVDVDAVFASLHAGGHHVVGPLDTGVMRIAKVVIGPAGVFVLACLDESDPASRIDTAARLALQASYVATVLFESPAARARVRPALLLNGELPAEPAEPGARLLAIEAAAFAAHLEASGPCFDADTVARLVARLESHVGRLRELRAGRRHRLDDGVAATGLPG